MRIDINETFAFYCIYKIYNSFLKLVYVFDHIERKIYLLFLNLVSNFRKSRRIPTRLISSGDKQPRNTLPHALYFTPADSISLPALSSSDSFSCCALLKKTLKNERDDDCDYERANNSATRQTDRGRRRWWWRWWWRWRRRRRRRWMMMMSKSRLA